MAKQNNGALKSKPLTLLDLQKTWFTIGDRHINVEDATDKEFDDFIRSHVEVGWSLEERRDVLNLALSTGKTLALQPENHEENQGKIQYTLISAKSADEDRRETV